jgi:hypothetical protein
VLSRADCGRRRGENDTRFKPATVQARIRNMASNPDLPPSKRRAPERGAAAADARSEGRAWLDNPENLRRFFEGVNRASERARVREERALPRYRD